MGEAHVAVQHPNLTPARPRSLKALLFLYSQYPDLDAESQNLQPEVNPNKKKYEAEYVRARF